MKLYWWADVCCDSRIISLQNHTVMLCHLPKHLSSGIQLQLFTLNFKSTLLGQIS